MSERSVARASAVAAVAAELADRGARLARPQVGKEGLVAVASTEIGAVHAMLVTAAPGPSHELMKLSPEQVRQWGRVIAELHEIGVDLVPGTRLPTLSQLVAEATDSVRHDGEVAAVVDGVRRQMSVLLGPVTVIGHGDPQPDNLAWAERRPTLFDFDDATASWPLADLVMAVRDLQPQHELGSPLTKTPIGEALIQGYQDIRKLDAYSERAVRVLERAHAAITYGRLRTALDSSEIIEPEWVRALRRRLEAVACALRATLVQPD